MKKKTLSDMRLRIFVLWLLFALLLTIVPFGGMREPLPMEMSEVFGMIKVLTGLWLPVLACFAAFWFNPTSAAEAKETIPGTGQVIGAYCFTAFYMLLASSLITINVFLVSVSIDPNTLEPYNEPLPKRVREVVEFLQLLSPVFLAPIAYLTGKAPEHRNV